ncbi:Alpha/Beta hydrolase protein [Chiua virens]|nr:Alpha/Beta hydrolase protein [Chiua virens]
MTSTKYQDHPLLHAKATSIRDIKRETFTYGPTEVHKLDVYYPPSWANDPPLFLVFFYDGGLTRGSRSSPSSYLVHNNLGAFFASRGILTVIPDYRLVPSITFPQGSEDVRDALEWVISSLTSKLPRGSESPTNASTTVTSTDQRPRCHLFVLGHSAGGIHLAGFLLTSFFRSSVLVRRALRGVALLGVPYDDVREYQPLGLLRSARDEDVAALPPVRNMVAESEPRAVSSSASVFRDVFQAKGGRITHHVLPGHDHVSPVLALSSGYGEEWGEELERWMRQLVSDHCTEQ